MSTTVEIDDVHEFMLDKITEGSDADYGEVVENLIYQAHQMQKDVEVESPEERE